jgi:protein translocase SecG subunit
MSWLFSVVLTVHILVALAIIVLVLMQHGKGADMGAAFGSGTSGSCSVHPVRQTFSVVRLRCWQRYFF